MKKLKKFTSLLMAMVMLVSCMVFTASAVEDKQDDISQATYYPTVNTSSWSKMSRTERVAACQISSNDAKSFSTEELLNAVVENPFMIDVYAFDSYEEGFKHVSEEFPLLKTLASRKDFGEVLINAYRNATVPSSEYDDNLDEDILTLSFLEILSAQPEMTNHLKNEELASLLEIADEKYLEKRNHEDIISGSLDTFYDAIGENPDSAIAVMANATVRTPKGTSVTVINNSSITDWSTSEKSALNSQYAKAYPNAYRLRDPSKKYNCHSYAWYSTSTSNYYWMNNPSAYMTDGSYSKASTEKAGNKVTWKSSSGEIIHSGIFATYQGGGPYKACTSKWGQLGLYNHKLADCPYSGTITQWSR